MSLPFPFREEEGIGNALAGEFPMSTPSRLINDARSSRTAVRMCADWKSSARVWRQRQCRAYRIQLVTCRRVVIQRHWILSLHRGSWDGVNTRWNLDCGSAFCWIYVYFNRWSCSVIRAGIVQVRPVFICFSPKKQYCCTTNQCNGISRMNLLSGVKAMS